MYTEEELLEAVDILVEDYGFDEDYAIDLVLESYEEELYEMDLYNEASVGRTVGGAALAAGALAAGGVAYNKYRKSKMPIRSAERRLEKAKRKLRTAEITRDRLREIDINSTPHREATFGRGSGRLNDNGKAKGKGAEVTVYQSDYSKAMDRAKQESKAERKVDKYARNVERKTRGVQRAQQRYDKYHPAPVQQAPKKRFIPIRRGK